MRNFHGAAYGTADVSLGICACYTDQQQLVPLAHARWPSREIPISAGNVVQRPGPRRGQGNASKALTVTEDGVLEIADDG